MLYVDSIDSGFSTKMLDIGTIYAVFLSHLGLFWFQQRMLVHATELIVTTP